VGGPWVEEEGREKFYTNSPKEEANVIYFRT